jgi:hypothetical protein
MVRKMGDGDGDGEKDRDRQIGKELFRRMKDRYLCTNTVYVLMR